MLFSVFCSSKNEKNDWKLCKKWKKNEKFVKKKTTKNENIYENAKQRMKYFNEKK